MVYVDRRRRPYDDKRKEIVRRSYQKNKHKRKAWTEKYKLRKRKVKGIGMIDVSIFNAKYIEQDGKCEICRKDIPLTGMDTHFDHNHETLELRGILCGNCNTGIGQLKESEDILLSAIAYLRKYQKGDR